MGDMRQQRFPWATPEDSDHADEVRLDPATIAQAIALLARAMIAVVRAGAEAVDER